MFTKIFVLVLVAVVVNSNPAAEDEWHWEPKRLSINPHTKDIVKPKELKPRPKVERVFVDNCGTAPLVSRIPHDVKIVGGHETIPHAYPWQAAIFIDGRSFCGGALISSEWVLTAGHCTLEATSLVVVLGAHNISAEEDSQVSLSTTDFITHPEFDMSDAMNDIALVHLPEAVTFNDYIQPVCLPAGEPDLGAEVSVTPTGWGKTEGGALTISDVLFQVTVPTISDDECSEFYGVRVLKGDMICINGTDGRGTCTGDSGGPLNYNTLRGWETRGITSFGPTRGCEVGEPDVLTRVAHYLDWIETNSGVTSSKK